MEIKRRYRLFRYQCSNCGRKDTVAGMRTDTEIAVVCQDCDKVNWLEKPYQDAPFEWLKDAMFFVTQIAFIPVLFGSIALFVLSVYSYFILGSLDLAILFGIYSLLIAVLFDVMRG